MEEISYTANGAQKVAVASGFTMVAWPTKIVTAKISFLGSGVIRRATDAEAALQHAQAAEKAKDNPHTKQGVTHLNAAIDHGKQGHADVATGHAQEATPMAALFVSMASRAVSGSRGHPPLVAARGLEPPGVAHVRMQSRYKQTGCCSVRRYAKGHQNCSLRQRVLGSAYKLDLLHNLVLTKG
jgi:Small metal-binding protein